MKMKKTRVLALFLTLALLLTLLATSCTCRNTPDGPGEVTTGDTTEPNTEPGTEPSTGTETSSGSETEPSPETATIYVHCNNGDTQPLTLTGEVGSAVEAPEAPTLTYFTFEGWYEDEALTVPYTFSVIPEHDIHVYAKFTTQRTMTITFDAMGGNAVPDAYIYPGESVPTLAASERNGYTFLGWFTDRECTKKFTATSVTEDITLYAGWLLREDTALLTVFINGELADTLPVRRGTAFDGYEALLGKFVSDGFYTDADCTVAWDTASAIPGNMTLYANAYTAGLTFSGGTVTGYTGEADTVVLPVRVNGVALTAIGDYAFDGTAIKSITIPETVSHIGTGAFRNCKRLERAVLSSNVTEIGQLAFLNCCKLTDIGDGISVTTVKQSTFTSCESLKSVVFLGKLTLIEDYAFSGCRSLETLDMGAYVTKIGDFALTNCTSLKTLVLSGALKSIGNGALSNLESVSDVEFRGDATLCPYKYYRGCLFGNDYSELYLYVHEQGETEYEVSVPKLTTIKAYAFSGAKNLVRVVLTDQITTIEESAFENCTSIREMVIPYLGNGADIDYFGYLFGASSYRENGIKAKKVPDSLVKITITGKLSEVPAYAFYGCNGLREVVGLENVTSIGDQAFAYTAFEKFTVGDRISSFGDGVFLGCEKLTAFVVSGSNKTYKAEDGCLYSKDGSVLISVPSGKTSVTINSSVRTIAEYAFAYSSVRTIVIPKSVTTVEKGAFYHCKLEELTLPFIGRTREYTETREDVKPGYNEEDVISKQKWTSDFTLHYMFGSSVTITETVTGKDGETPKYAYTSEFENMYAIPSSLRVIHVTEPVKVIRPYTFYSATGLKTIDVTGVEEIGMFSHVMTALDEVVLPASVRVVGRYAYANIQTLTRVVIPGTVESLGEACFCMNGALATVELGEGLTEIPAYGFYPYAVTNTSAGTTTYTSKLTEITIPASVKRIGDAAFYRAGATDGKFTVTFAAGTVLEEIGGAAFYGSALSEVHIPATVKILHNEAFSTCLSLVTVYIGNETEGSRLEHIGALCFANMPNLQDCWIYKDVRSVADLPTMDLFLRSKEYYGPFVVVNNGENVTLHVRGLEFYMTSVPDKDGKETNNWLTYYGSEKRNFFSEIEIALSARQEVAPISAVSADRGRRDA